MRKKILAAIMVTAAILATAGCAGNSASNYPNKPVTVVCPFAAVEMTPSSVHWLTVQRISFQRELRLKTEQEAAEP